MIYIANNYRNIEPLINIGYLENLTMNETKRQKNSLLYFSLYRIYDDELGVIFHRNLMDHLFHHVDRWYLYQFLLHK